MMRRKRTTSGSHFGEMRSMQGSHCHVATSPRRDVTKSRRGGQQMQKSTIHHVATSPRRGVSSKICISSLNARGLGILGIEERAARDTEFENLHTDFKDLFGFLYWFFFIVLIISGSHEDVIHITYFVVFFHDVLNSFLGLHQTLSQTMD